MNIASLQQQYAAGETTAAAVASAIYDKIEASGLSPIWIAIIPREQATKRAEALAVLSLEEKAKLPLYGIPFAVKDNLDVAGLPTTAACPAFVYTPAESATVVQKLEAAGAILIGKTNMDQFATGLVGTRTPYGICSSVFSKDHISGGSSSGSAVAVASGLVSFSLGTDTAGSGRVPAMFNNLVGLKPTKGALSTHGLVPACRTLDCVSIFAETASDAAAVLAVAQGLDPKDPYSRQPGHGAGAAPWAAAGESSAKVKVGVLPPAQREFFGDAINAGLYQAAIETLPAIGCEAVEVDLSVFLDTAKLLYQGPWVAERFAAISSFIGEHLADMDPTVGTIISGAKNYSAVQCFEAAYRLEAFRRLSLATWLNVDVLLLPTAPKTFTIAEIAEKPIERNSQLGTYTNFVNLLDLAAVAVPAGMRPDGLPFGVTFMGQAFSDTALLALGDKLHRALGKTLGGSERTLASTPALAVAAAPQGCQLLAVVGAHLTGQPLNWQLTQRGGHLVRTCRTQPDYKLYALANTTPPKPGLVWSPGFTGPGIEVEVWALPTDTIGSFLELIPQPLGLGTLRLEDGSLVKGFICEPACLEAATEITHFGGWRKYLAASK